MLAFGLGFRITPFVESVSDKVRKSILEEYFFLAWLKLHVQWYSEKNRTLLAVNMIYFFRHSKLKL